jgi:hypothetical protein
MLSHEPLFIVKDCHRFFLTGHAGAVKLPPVTKKDVGDKFKEIRAAAFSTTRDLERQTESDVSYQVAESYRVTVNGPAPGPGLINRFGSMRFTEGGSMDWGQ